MRCYLKIKSTVKNYMRGEQISKKSITTIQLGCAISVHLFYCTSEDLHCACQLLSSTLPSKTMGIVNLKLLAAAVSFQPHEGCEDFGQRSCWSVHSVER